MPDGGTVDDVLAVRSARLFPGGGRPVVSPALLLVDGGVILDVDGTGASPPAAAEVVDLGEATLLPGLVDAHVHLCFDASEDVVGPLLSDDDATVVARMQENATLHLAAGVTTVRDLGDRRFLGLTLRERYERGDVVGPELLVAGPPLTRLKGHCWFLGGEVDGVDELRAAVVERAARRCDVVKIMATGGVLTPGFGPHQSQYGAPELRAVVLEADGHGLEVAAHAHGVAGISHSIEAGVRSVEHCTFLTDQGVEVDWRIVERLVAAEILVGLTLALLPDVPPPPHVARILDRVDENVAGMHRVGVRLVCSSDAGVGPPKPPGVLPHGAVKLAGLGLTNSEALESVTSVAAEACGIGGRKGRVAAGFDADLLAVEGDPLTDIRSLLDVAAVFRAGIRVR